MTRWVCRRCGHGLDTHGLREDEEGPYFGCVQCSCAFLIPSVPELEYQERINKITEAEP